MCASSQSPHMRLQSRLAVGARSRYASVKRFVGAQVRGPWRGMRPEHSRADAEGLRVRQGTCTACCEARTAHGAMASQGPWPVLRVSEDWRSVSGFLTVQSPVAGLPQECAGVPRHPRPGHPQSLRHIALGGESGRRRGLIVRATTRLVRLPRAGVEAMNLWIRPYNRVRAQVQIAKSQGALSAARTAHALNKREWFTNRPLPSLPVAPRAQATISRVLPSGAERRRSPSCLRTGHACANRS
jgi:hypothetical protein